MYYGTDVKRKMCHFTSLIDFFKLIHVPFPVKNTLNIYDALVIGTSGKTKLEMIFICFIQKLYIFSETNNPMHKANALK